MDLCQINCCHFIPHEAIADTSLYVVRNIKIHMVNYYRLYTAYLTTLIDLKHLVSSGV